MKKPVPKKRLQPIKLVILDADGVLTDNNVWIAESGERWQKFSIADGMGISMGKRGGLNFAIISGNSSQAILQRAQELKIEHCYVGVKAKLPIFEQLKKIFQVTDHEIAYIGNDINDLSLLKQVGFAACVADSIGNIKRHCHYVARRKGGDGAVREIIELILQGQAKKLVW